MSSKTAGKGRTPGPQLKLKRLLTAAVVGHSPVKKSGKGNGALRKALGVSRRFWATVKACNTDDISKFFQGSQGVRKDRVAERWRVEMGAFYRHDSVSRYNTYF